MAFVLRSVARGAVRRVQPAVRRVCARRSYAIPQYDWLDPQLQEKLEADKYLNPTTDELDKEGAYWDEVARGRYPDELKVELYENAPKEEDLPHNRLAQHALNKENRQSRKAQAEVTRLRELMTVHLSFGRKTLAFNCFMEMREAGVPTPEAYDEAMALLIIWNDYKAMDMLSDEMSELGYPRGLKTHLAYLHRYMITGNAAAVEEQWRTIAEAKYDLHYHIYCHMIAFYTRICPDVDKAKEWYRRTQESGKMTDSSATNLMLDLGLTGQNWALMDEYYADAEKRGLLNVSVEDDSVKVKFEGLETEAIPKQKITITTYLLMAEAMCDRKDEAGMRDFIDKARRVHDLHSITKGITMLELHARLYEKMIRLYLEMKNIARARMLLEEMNESQLVPSEEIFRDIMIYYMRNQLPRHYQEFKSEFDLIGYQLDETLYKELLAMWFNVRDDRRFLNTYDEMIKNMVKPGIEERTMMIEVYARSGRVDDVQRFYDRQVFTKQEISPKMHLVMANDYLKRGYPGSARMVVQRMLDSGIDVPVDLMENVAVDYARLGGGPQIAKLIEDEMEGPKARFPLTATVLSAAVEGFSKIRGNQIHKHIAKACSNYISELWDRYSDRVQLDVDSATRALRAFSNMGQAPIVQHLYENTLPKLSLTHMDPWHEYFQAVLDAPLTNVKIEQRVKVIDDIKSLHLEPSPQHYLSLMKTFTTVAATTDAVQFMKRFVAERYGHPLHRAFVLEFFTILMRFDMGKYRREAEVWIQRIMPTAKTNALNIPSPRGADETLEQAGNNLMSRVQSIEVSKYISNIDESVLTPTPVRAYDDLFQGSAVDVEDQLIHEHGLAPKDVHEAMEKDPEFEAFAKRMEISKPSVEKALPLVGALKSEKSVMRQQIPSRMPEED